MSLTAFHIRNATEEDLPQILLILNEAIKNTTAIYHYEEHSESQFQQWFQDKQLHNFPVFVIEENSTIMAYGTYGTFRPFAGFQFTVEHSVYVHPEYQGKGLGKLLLKALIEKATTDGFHCMIAGIDAENTSSIAFHKKFGFKEAGRFPEAGRKFDRWLDLVFMQLLLK